MADYILGVYPEFSCLADRCTDTCCHGWNIHVDQQAYERFLRLDNESLRTDILSHTYNRDGRYYFYHKDNGDCIMLDTDHLCRIQRNSSEEMLCNTCRKYPRLLQQDGKNNWLSMAASCPVVSQYLVHSQVHWFYSDEAGTIQLENTDLPWWKDMIAVLQRIKSNLEPQGLAFVLCWDNFCDMANQMYCQMQQISAGANILESLRAYSKEKYVTHKKSDRRWWESFFYNYLSYRIPYLLIEKQEYSLEQAVRLCLGELVLLRVLFYNVDTSAPEYSSGEHIMNVLQGIYRLVAHGKISQQQLTKYIFAMNDDSLCIAFPERMLLSVQ